jgi:hypothetical protein
MKKLLLILFLVSLLTAVPSRDKAIKHATDCGVEQTVKSITLLK